MAKIIVTRFSALGDVAMLAVILPEFLLQHPNVEVVVVSRASFKHLFAKHPQLQFIGVDFDHEYKGIMGMRRLAQTLKKLNPTHYADCHNVIRTQILHRFLALPTAVLDKARAEKRQLTQRKNKHLRPLESMHERYADVFRKLGFECTLSHQLTLQSQEKAGYGFAPFAFYKQKMLPLEKSKELTLQLASHGCEIYLFGGGELEEEILKEWEILHENIISLAGKFDFKEEIQVMKRLELMISMDSANMHLASLAGTRVISIWGATHPYLGFLGYGQSYEDCVQIEDLFCRPCSVYGKKECYRKSIECLEDISVDSILQKLPQ